MTFDPNNPIVKICLEAMPLQASGRTKEADQLLHRAWDSAANEFEKWLSAYFLALNQRDFFEQLRWLQESLQIALKLDDFAVRSALPSLYSGLAKCHEALGNSDQAMRFRETAKSLGNAPSDTGPFYHGTKADLKSGDLLTAGGISNYKTDLKMNHIYFTALINGAGLAAALANGDQPERIYVVEPTDTFENDPNVTDKKFPGNLTRSYRSRAPLKVIGEIKDWKQRTPEEIRNWRDKLARNKGEIIN